MKQLELVDSNITHPERCTICGSYITGNTCQDENENIICEDCLIQRIAERKGLI